ncbi:MAG TPA: hypothetical protein VI702_03305, partial [Nitrospiria bacterium]
LNSHKRAFDLVVRSDRQEFLWLLCQSTSEGAQNLAARIGEWLSQQPAVVEETRYTIRIKTAASTLGPLLQSEEELMEQARAGLLILK